MIAVATQAADGTALDLRTAQIVVPRDLTPTGKQAIALLTDEAARRSGIHWTETTVRPVNGPAIVVTERGAGMAPESFSIKTSADTVSLIPADDRGLLFAAGYLLRSLRLAPGRSELPAPLNVTTAPRYPLRGIQLGFRAISNTYGSWSLPQFDQQIRDLAVFGCNAIELVAGFQHDTPGALTMPSLDNMEGVSAICARYGLDVWVWTPARENNYRDHSAVTRTLHEWEAIFRRLPRIDGIYVPGGDPGDTPPELLLPLVEAQAKLLHRYHPKAGVWISVQGFNRAHLDYFFNYLRTRQPEWLAGVIQSSWTDLTVAQIRARTPPQYRVRSCVDIGHVLHCMYPVHELDTAFAITEGREPVCPRPEAMKVIARSELPRTYGSIAYSDGVNDDVNKICWLQFNWNPDASTTDILREYGRYFVGDAVADQFAKGLALLERNWQGPLASNHQVALTFDLWRGLERHARPQDLHNWRFLSALYRAYYDRFTQLRLAYESDLERRATAILNRVEDTGAERTIRDAQEVLDQAVRQPVGVAERTRVCQLGEALFQTIGMKLSVRLYHASAVTRGANLDSVDWPLNNRVWLEGRFAAIRQLSSETERRRQLLAIAHWTDPGPGGFYDNPGQPGTQTRANTGAGWAADPAGHESAFAMKVWIKAADFRTHRIAWLDHVGTLGETPLTMTYTGLDTHATYTLRLVSGDTKLNGRVRLTANETFELHPLQASPVPTAPETYAIPAAATAGGRLVLKWERDPALASIHGVCHVSEIWLLKNQ